MWSLVYFDPPGYLVVNQDCAYRSGETLKSAEVFGIHLDVATVETSGAIGTVERYYSLLRLAYGRVCTDTDRHSKNQDWFGLAVFAVNCKVDVKSLCVALLDLGAIHRLAQILPAPSQWKQARLIDIVTKKIVREQTRRKTAIRFRNSYRRKAKEHSMELWKVPAGYPV